MSGICANATRQGSLFVGSFNINSEDLSQEDAKAWLAKAADAEVVALGLQECGVLPANPFPSPTNGKAVTMWREAHKAMLQGDSSASNTSIFAEEGREPQKPSALAGLVQCIVGASKPGADDAICGDGHRNDGMSLSPLPPLLDVPVARHNIGPRDFHLPGRPNTHTNSNGDTIMTEGGALMMTDGDNWDSPDTSFDGSDRVPKNRREMFSGVKEDGSSSTGTAIRQESYYLRGVVEAERDERLLGTIKDCIPGRELIADVAMGETPTHGKIEVKVSPPRSRPRPASIHLGDDELPTLRSTTKRAASTGKLGAMSLGNMSHPDHTGDMHGHNHNRGHTPDSSDGDGGAGEEASGEAGTRCRAVEWYGTIRLLVFVKKGLYKNLTVKTVVIPSGDKPSVVADAPEDYAKDTSPDKGAVACHLHDEDPNAKSPLNLLLVHCHLYGTNKYGVPEAVFDKYRMSQLRATDKALRATLPSSASKRMVLFGDLNFRVEMKSGEQDKDRAGNDFQAVVKVAQEGDDRALLALYNEADRLRPLLLGAGAEREERGMRWQKGGLSDKDNGANNNGENEGGADVPELLKGLQDGLAAALGRGEVVRPSFTYKPGDTSHTPRRYNDKRTPSWTDRILWRGFSGDERQGSGEAREDFLPFASVPAVIVSDHEPVYCLLEL